VDGGGDERRIRARGDADLAGKLDQTLDAARRRDQLAGRRVVGKGQRSAEVEPFDDGAGVDAFEHSDENVANGRPDQVPRHLLGPAQLAFVLELEFARDGGQRGVDVGYAWDDEFFTVGE